MGNDGGSIPKRRELVKEAARAQTAAEAKETQQERHSHRWATCAISQKPLQAPIVSDYMGFLYNKDAIIECLLPSDDAVAKEDAAVVLTRVSGLKDLVEVKFQEDSPLEPGQEDAGKSGSTWVCPITNKQLGSGVKAAYIVPCGHAFSEIALKEVAELVCLQCNQPYEASNIVTILPQKEDDKARLQRRHKDLKAAGLTHSLKKASSKKKRKNKDMNGEATSVGEEHANGTSTAKSTTKANGVINNAATASLTAKVLAEEEARAKRRKADPLQSANVRSLFSTGEKERHNGDFMTRGFSIPGNAKR